MTKRVLGFILVGLLLIFFGIWIFSFNKTKAVQVIPQVATLPTATSLSTFAKVTRVIDGDTIVVDTGQKIRYIGVNTPETETLECYATEAGEINKNLVLEKVVRLEKDVSETDKYGRLLRYVYVDNHFVNDELVKEGAAKIETVSPDIKYKKLFLESQNYAKENNLGLWSKCFK
ncbi:MAG TPA: thermonuclease family protein [Patescibacteria group bacterium]|nr:thermonuclease family protein [Patescibacteria group bacterium]